MLKGKNIERWDRIFSSDEGDIARPLPFLIHELDRLKSNGRALDLGCGTGRHSIQLARRGLETHGLDLSFRALEKTNLSLQAEGLPISLGQGDMGHLPYRNDIFDLVVSINVIHHNDSQGALKCASEIWRILKPGGYLLATIAATSHFNFGKGRLIAEKTFLRDSGVETGILHYFMDEKDVRSYFRHFTIEYLSEETSSCFFNETIGKDDHHWFLTARKKSQAV